MGKITLGIVFYLSLIAGATIFLPTWFYNGFETPKFFLVQVGAVAFVFLWLLRAVLKGVLEITLPWIAMPLVALFLLAAVSISWGINPWLGFEELYRIATLSSFCFFAFYLYRNRNVVAPLHFILLVSLVLSTWALMLEYCPSLRNWVYPPYYTAKVVVPGTHSYFYNPLMGNQGNPTFLMHVLVLSVPIALGAFVQQFKLQRRTASFILALAVAVPAFCILSSQNRSGLIALSVGVGLFLCTAFRWKDVCLWLQQYKRLVACGALIFIVLAAVTPYSKNWHTRFSALRDLNSITVYSRVVFLETGASMIRENPWLGQGIGQFVLNYPGHKTEKHWEVFSMRHPPILRWADMPKQSHNEFLQVLLATGVLGLILFVSFWILLFVTVLRYLKKRKDRCYYLMLGMGAGLFGTLMNALFTFPLQTVTSSLFFWTTVGLLLAHCKVSCWTIRIPLKSSISKAFLVLVASGFLLLCSYSSVRLISARYLFFDALRTHATDLTYGIQQCENSIRLVPHHFETQYVLAFLYSYAGRYPEARQQLETTIKLAPYFPEPYRLLRR